jgi:DNA polymerase III subunit gamma/tau
VAKDKDEKKKKKKDKGEGSVILKNGGDISLESMAVKYRPRCIDDLVGQDAIVSQVKGMLKSGKFSNSMLLNGSSGCGKTTTARIIARTLFCSNLGEGFKPCGECPSCRYGDSHPDLAEINMAETRGIDDVRQLIASSKNMPTIGKFRIFIIDEVHAWTTQAEQAFLKPLEEPPTRTMWILCTTNPEKLKPTIVGRCKKLPVQLIEPEVMMQRLSYIAKKEGLDLKEREDGKQILRAVADMSNGHMRDGIEMLESVIYALRENSKLDAKSIMSKVLTAGEADLDKASAYFVASVLNGDLKDVVHQTRAAQNARGLLNKSRWLIQYLLDNAVGLAKYSPYNAKIFAKIAKENNVKVKLNGLIKLQYTLIEVENRFNTMSIDETVQLQSMIGNFIIEHILPFKEKKAKE